MKSVLQESIPPALVAPDLIKLEAIPSKIVYDFTKRSKNQKFLEEGLFERFECEERCDSRL